MKILILVINKLYSNYRMNEHVIELIMEARKKLIAEKIVKPDILNKPVRATSSYSDENYDWRYLMAGLYLK